MDKKATTLIKQKLQFSQKTGVVIFLVLLTVNFSYYQIISFNFPNFYWDPEYTYFLNSLLPFKESNYTYIDHPGTPVEMIGTVLLALTYPFVRLITKDFIFFHLSNPIYFLILARLTLMIFTSIAIWKFSKYAVKIKDWASILMLFSIIASYFAIHPDSFITLSFWSHNSFNFPAGSLLLFAIWLIFKKDLEITTKQEIILGGLTGVLVAFQLYFLTWTIGAVVSFGMYRWYTKKKLYEVIKSSLIVGVGAVLGFILATIPIIEEYPRFSIWVANLVLHDGIYGGGNLGITSPDMMLSSLIEYSTKLLPLFLSIAILEIFILSAIFIMKWKVNKGIKSYTIGLTVQILITTIIILKHPQQIYFLAVAATLPLLLIITFELLENKKSWNIKLNKKDYEVSKIIIGAIFSLTTILFINNFIASIQEYNQRKDTFTNYSKLVEHTTENYAKFFSKNVDDIVVLVSYQVHDPCYAMNLGNRYANFAFNQEVFEICGNKLIYKIETNTVVTIQGEMDVESYKWDLFFLDKRYTTPYPELLDYGILVELDDNYLAVIIPKNAPEELVQQIKQ